MPAVMSVMIQKLLLHAQGLACSGRAVAATRPRSRPGLRFGAQLAAFGALAAVAVCVVAEARTSFMEARWLPRMAQRMSFAVVSDSGHDTALQEAVFPRTGPYDSRLGYVQLPGYIDTLGQHHYAVTARARISPELRRWIEAGNYAVYHEKSGAGLRLLDRDKLPLYAARFPQHGYGSYAEVPTLVLQTLLFIEDRHLLDADPRERNPAVDWSRFLFAMAGQLGSRFDHRLSQGGASTLATQIEKFRHSDGGRTRGYAEKVRQMEAASLRIYQDGADTMPARRQLAAAYLDSTPLGSRPAYGEIIGLGEGLWAWYGIDPAEANRVLEDPLQTSGRLLRRAQVYKQVLSLLLAQRRPSWYLPGEIQALDALTNRYLRLLRAQGLIDAGLCDAALGIPLVLRVEAPPPEAVPYVRRKATNALRGELLSLLGAPNLNSLDRLDLSVASTIDKQAQERVTDVLSHLGDADYAASLGLIGHDLLDDKHLDGVAYSVVLYERGADRNFLRVRADSLNQPFDINSGAKLILGSTAKLRTLITYLDVVSELRERLESLPRDKLKSMSGDEADPLSAWAAAYLLKAKDHSLQAMLNAAMQRRYSSDPAAVFLTGGGDQVFRNFNKSEDHLNPTVEQAFTLSINLSFIRLLRDLTRYYTAQEQGPGQLHSIAAEPLRQEYLRRFADQEGRAYLNRYYDDYHRLDAEQALDLLADRAYAEPRSQALLFRALRPRATVQELGAFLRTQLPQQQLDPGDVRDLFDQNYPDRYPLNDQGYLAGAHPLELWLAVWLHAHPGATRTELMQASTEQRQEVYAWLFKSRRSAAQNRRIGILLEQQAFERIHQDWQRQGYPFSHMVASLASAIGSSGDRPDALAELMGIIANGGVQLPAMDIDSLHFAAATPYETSLRYVPAAPRRVLRPEVAATVRQALEGVVDHGTALRLRGSYQPEQADSLSIGGKTGTGDNRFDTYGPGRQLISSRLVNRSATFVFFLGAHYYGAVTAYVSGEGAADFHFTSSLVVQLLRGLAPALQPLLDRERAGAGQPASAGGCRSLPQGLVLRDVPGWLEQSSFDCWSGNSIVAAVPLRPRSGGRKPGEDALPEAARTARRAAPAAPAGDG